MIKKEQLDKVVSKKTMEESEYLSHKIKIDRTSEELLQSFLLFSNEVSNRSLNLLLANYDLYKSQITSFIDDGGKNYDKSNLKCGFTVNGQNALYQLVGSIERLKGLKNTSLENGGDGELKAIQELDTSRLFDVSQGYRTPTMEISFSSGNYLKQNLSLLDSNIQNIFEKSSMLKLADLDSKTMRALYENGISKMEEGSLKDNFKLFKEGSNVLSKIVKEEIIKIDKNTLSLDFVDDNGNITENSKKIYDLMKKELSTQWLKDNSGKFSQKVIEDLGIKNPVVEFVESIIQKAKLSQEKIFKDKSLSNEEKTDKISDILNQAQALASNLMSDNSIKEIFTPKSLIEYIRQDFPDGAVFKSMLYSLDEVDLNYPYDENYTLEEAIISELVGENSSCCEMNTNKLACLMNLISHKDFDPDKLMSISTSKHLDSITEQHFNDVAENNTIKSEVVSKKLIPEQLKFNGNNKISVLDFLSRAQDHLTLQHANSDKKNFDKEKIISSKDGLLATSFKYDMLNILKNSNINGNLGATKFKGKVQKMSDYCNNWNGPISSLIGFAGVLACSILLGFSKIAENTQNKNIKNSLNNLSGEEKSRVEKVETKIAENGDVTISVVANDQSFEIGRGANLSDLKEIPGANLLQSVSTQKMGFLNALNNLDVENKNSIDIEKFKSNHPVCKMIDEYNSKNPTIPEKTLNKKYKSVSGFSFE